MPRIHCLAQLAEGEVLALPDGAARHVQVLRMQPGQSLTLFTGQGGEWQAVIERMGRSDVVVRMGPHADVEREPARAVHLAVGLAANERMDWLVEKATELGVASIQPLATSRSVLKLTGERAARKLAHWQAIAVAACEQCGRNRVPPVHELLPIERWLPQAPAADHRALLSFHERAQSPARHGGAALVLSGPEGGLSPQEEQAALAAGFVPTTLGRRVLRAETAPLAALAVLTIDT